MSTHIVPITHQSYRQAAQVLGKAFVDEPVSITIYRNFTPEKRVQALTADFTEELKLCLHRGHPIQIVDGDRILAAAAVYPPGVYPLPQFYQWDFLLKSVLRNGRYDVKSWLKWLKEVDRIHPTKAHYYLLYIGVDPVCQGKGYGSSLLQHLVDKADAAGFGCYLENASPRNLPFYQRFGFQVIQEKEIIGLPSWFMWRESVKSS